MSNQQKVVTIIRLSNDIKAFMEDKKSQLGLTDSVEIETLIYTMFSVISDKLKANPEVDKSGFEQFLQKSFNQYLVNAQLDLYVQKLEYPPRIGSN